MRFLGRKRRKKIWISYLIHTPVAFQPGDEQDPRDQNGNVIYDLGVTLLDTWRAM
jgi:alcohol dehydrogenase (NADP+)